MMNKNHPVSHDVKKNHSFDLAWQILVPVLSSVLITLSLAILAIIASVQNPGIEEKWGQISLIFMILPFLVIGLILILVLILTCRLINKVYHFLPPQFTRIINIVNSIGSFVNRSLEKTTAPLIQIKSFKAGTVRLLDLAFRRDRIQRRNHD